MDIKSDFFTSSVGNRELILEKNVEAYERAMNRETEVFTKALEDRNKAEVRAKKALEAAKAGANEQAIKEADEAYMNALKARYDAEDKLKQAKLAAEAKVTRVAQIAEQNRIKKMNAASLRAYQKEIYEKLKLDEAYRNQSIKELSKELDEKIKLQNAATNEDQKKKLQADIDSIKTQIDVHVSDNEKQNIAKNQMSSFGKLESLFDPKVIEEKGKLQNDLANEEYKAASKQYDLAKVNKDAIEEQFLKQEEVQAAIKKMKDAEKAGDKKAFDEAQAQLNALHEQNIELKAAESALDKAESEKSKARTKAFWTSMSTAASNTWSTALANTAKSLDSNLEALYGEQGRMKGRLQGSDTDWEKSVVKIMSVVGSSGVVSQKDLVKKMSTLVDSGVAYNLEMRAFIAETAENIASTFDATNSTLLRLIRIQQSDTTAARLGMESTLTKLFNSFFQDTSYLAQDVSDSVSASILDASAQLTKNQSLEFEYIVQKWLGSLYSVGLSSEAVNLIAQGINALGTGDYTALNDSGFATLFGLSASRSGGRSLTELITGGVDADETNMLLRSMVDYLAEIAEGDDKLVKATYAKMFNMSVTDLSTFSKLREHELNSIYKSSVSYNSLMDETESQLRQSISRLSVAELVDTAIENSEVGAAALIGSNPITYGTWKALSVLKDYVGEINIPGITAFGNGITSSIDLINTAQTSMVGLGLVGSLVAGVSSMLKGGATDLSNWDFSEFTDRSKALKNYIEVGGYLSNYTPNKTSSGVSYSASVGVGNASSEDISTASLSSAQSKAKSSSIVGTEEQEEQLEMDKKIYESVADPSTQGILSVASEIRDLLAYDRIFYTQMQTAVVSTGFGASITATPTSNTNLITNKITELAAAPSGGISASVTSEEKEETLPQTTVSSDSYGSTSTYSSSDNSATLDIIIQTAVEQALSSIMNRYVSTGIPVDVKNNIV